MKFKKITLLIGLLCLFTIQAQVNETPFSQFPETLTLDEWSVSDTWDELTITTAEFNMDCMVTTNTTSFAGSDTAKTLYTYNSDNLLDEIISQFYNVNVWVNISKTQNIYVGSILTEEIGFFWDGANWLMSSRILNTYNGSSQPSVQIYQGRNPGNTTWENNNRIVYSYNASGLIEQELYQTWNTMTMSWDNEELDIYIYSGSNVSQILYNVWDGSDWVPDEKSDVIYNDEQQIKELIISVWDVSVYVPDSKTLFAYSNGLISEFIEQVYNVGVWENEVRATYTYPDCASLSTSEYETFNFSFSKPFRCKH